LALILWGSRRSFRIGVGGLTSYFLTLEFLGQFALETLLFPRFQEKGVFLDLFNNALLLDLAFETPKGALNGLTVKYPNLCQNMPP
jgi:hypothetical protein